MPDPHLRMCEFNLSVSLADAGAFANMATQMVIEDVVNGRLNYLVLVTFTGTKARLWQIHDPPDGQLDDLVRVIAAREKADGLAFVYPMPAPNEVDADRCYNVSGECGSGQFDSLIALKGGTGLGGEQFRIYGRRISDVGPRWFGREPDNEIELWMEGIVGAVVPGGEA